MLFMDKTDQDIQILLNLAYFFLKFRRRTKKEMRDYLLKKIRKTHWSTNDVEEIFKKLEELEFIDDEKFIEWYVETRSRTKPKSDFVLKQELMRLGIEKEMLDKYFEGSPGNEEELAYKALLPRWERFNNLDRKGRFQKASQFLLRRGFSYEIVRKAINNLEEARLSFS